MRTQYQCVLFSARVQMNESAVGSQTNGNYKAIMYQYDQYVRMRHLRNRTTTATTTPTQIPGLGRLIFCPDSL